MLSKTGLTKATIFNVLEERYQFRLDELLFGDFVNSKNYKIKMSRNLKEAAITFLKDGQDLEDRQEAVRFVVREREKRVLSVANFKIWLEEHLEVKNKFR